MRQARNTDATATTAIQTLVSDIASSASVTVIKAASGLKSPVEPELQARTPHQAKINTEKDPTKISRPKPTQKREIVTYQREL